MINTVRPPKFCTRFTRYSAQ